MSRRLKILAIFFILIFPSAIYVFLTAGKEQAFVRMPYYGPKPVVHVQEKGGKVKSDTLFYHIPAFRFYTQYGDTITNLNLFKRVWVASFASFSAKNTPSLAVTMNRVEQRTNLDTALRLVTFTLDSESVKSMQNYARIIHTSDKRRLFLSGPKKQLNDFAVNGFYKAVDSSYSKGFNYFFLIDKQGCIRGIYNGLLVKQVDNLIDDISMLEAAYYITNEKKHSKEHTNDPM